MINSIIKTSEPFKNLCLSSKITNTQGEQFTRDDKAGKSIGGKDGALGSLIKQLTEATLTAEIDSHLTQDLSRNCKNGYAQKLSIIKQKKMVVIFQK